MLPALTTAQRVTLKTHITGNSDTNALYVAGNLAGLAAMLNLAAAPSIVVWKTFVLLTLIGDNINAAELAGLTTLNATRLQTIALYSPTGLNPTLADRRQFFDDVFSGAGGATTRAQLLALWKRSATRVEHLYNTGTGSDASPGTIVSEGPLDYTELIGL